MTPVDSDGGDQGSPRHWMLVFALLAISIYAFIDRAVLALLVDPIRQDLGASDRQMALLMGLVFALFSVGFMIPAGHLVDRYNRRAIIGVASALWAVMTIVCGTADSMEQLFLGRAGVGIAESVIAPASFSLIRDAVPRRSRGLAFSLYAMAPLIGGMTGLASFFLGTSYSVGASTLGEVTLVRLMGKVTAVYFIFQSLLGQALGPFPVAFGSQTMFTGRTALATSFALWMGVFGVGMVIAVAVLRARLRRSAVTPGGTVAAMA